VRGDVGRGVGIWISDAAHRFASAMHLVNGAVVIVACTFVLPLVNLLVVWFTWPKAPNSYTVLLFTNLFYVFPPADRS
jgi:hypothetical protein